MMVEVFERDKSRDENLLLGVVHLQLSNVLSETKMPAKVRAFCFFFLFFFQGHPHDASLNIFPVAALERFGRVATSLERSFAHSQQQRVRLSCKLNRDS